MTRRTPKGRHKARVPNRTIRALRITTRSYERNPNTQSHNFGQEEMK